jgi:dephospho-CoA kinase
VLIGLTGPIGCGKSTVGRMLADVGGVLIDADAVSRQVTDTDADAQAQIRQRFGADVFVSGKLDRAALAAIVFADAGALRDLEQIVHPRVRRLVDERLAAAAAEGAPFVAVEAIKLVEGGLADRCDEVWLVSCAPGEQRSRLSGRGMSSQDADRRLAAQGQGLADRLARAIEGRVPVRQITTDGSLDSTREAVEEALAEVLDRPLT